MDTFCTLINVYKIAQANILKISLKELAIHVQYLNNFNNFIEFYNIGHKYCGECDKLNTNCTSCVATSRFL